MTKCKRDMPGAVPQHPSSGLDDKIARQASFLKATRVIAARKVSYQPASTLTLALDPHPEPPSRDGESKDGQPLEPWPMLRDGPAGLLSMRTVGKRQSQQVSFNTGWFQSQRRLMPVSRCYSRSIGKPRSSKPGTNLPGSGCTATGLRQVKRWFSQSARSAADGYRIARSPDEHTG